LILSHADSALIARLLALPAAERAAALAQACAADPALSERLPEIERTLAASDAVASVPAAWLAPDALIPVIESALHAAKTETAGTLIGPYKLLQPIGEGGFGVVWMAEQLAPIRRQVAVKIIKLGMDTEEVITRFEAERQALALMEHPNIARVFDAGATDSGRPYFVMELVRGTAITRYCDENRLPTGDRLRLFTTVCSAVQHAHQKGVIHRDLKPSNILVTLHDGVPGPKIIDFGIAKATSARLTEKTFFTQFRAFLGTPAYTSPEQMELSGLDVDTRSDIYSLGVLLYELLTGRPPFDPAALMQSGLEAMRRTIREVDPPRPSTRLDTLSREQRTSLAQQRGTEAAKLSLLLRGDLDWIVMRCLEKDRTRRYDSASNLGADVQRYLADEPVAARPPSAAYRLQKSFRRHRLGFIAGATVAVAVVAALGLTVVLLVRERAARERESTLRRAADAQAAQARLASRKSAQVAQFMKDMLAGVAPSVARGRDTAMLREILDATAQKLDTELADQPEVAADLRDTLGVVYCDLGQYAPAEKLLREAVAARRKLNGNESAELATSLDNYATVLGWLGKTESEQPMLEALAIRRKLFGDKHPLVATTLHHLSHLPAKSLGKFEDWAALREKVLALRLEIFGPEHPDVAESLNDMGIVAYQRNDLAESERLLRQAIAMRRKLVGPDDPLLVDSLINLGWTLSEDHRWPEAEALFREGLELAIRVRPEHPLVTCALLRLAGGQPRVVRDDALVALVRAAVAAQSTRLGPRAPSVAVSSLALAALLSGRPETADEARTLTLDAEAVLDSNRNRGSRLEFQTIQDMQVFSSQRLYTAAAPEQALAVARQFLLNTRVFGSAFTASPLSLLAMAYFYTNRPAEARALWAEAVPIFQEQNGAVTVPTLPYLSMLGAANRETGRLAEAERVLRDGLAVMKQSLGAAGVPDPAVAAVYCELGLTLNAQSRFAEAEIYFRQSLENHDRVGREKASRARMRLWLGLRPRGEAESGLGEALAGQGKFADAEPLLLHGFAALEAQRDKLAGSRTKLRREAAARLVAFYTAQNQPDRREKWMQQLAALAPDPRPDAGLPVAPPAAPAPAPP